MERTTYHEETTRVVEQPVVGTTHVHDTHHKDKKQKKSKKDKNAQYGPKKSVGTKLKEFFTGRRDDGIIYQNGLPIAGLNGPIVQPMGAPIRQPAEIHPVATVNATNMHVGNVPGDHIYGPTTTTYGPAPPIAPGFPEGVQKTTTTTEIIRPGAELLQPMNAIAQPTGLGAIAQPAGVIIAGADKRVGLKEGYLKDQKVHAYPHGKTHDKAMTNPYQHDKHHHEDVYTNTTGSYIEQPVVVEQQVAPVIGEPAPAIYTGPARVLNEKEARHANDPKYQEKQARKEEKLYEKEMKREQKEHLKEEKRHEKEMKAEQKLHEKEAKHHHTNVDQVNMGPSAAYQPTHLEQQSYPVTVTGPAQPGFIPPNATMFQPQPAILQQPGMAPTNQPLVRNHQQVPMNSQSGLAQGGLFQNDTAQPVQTFTPVVQQNQLLTETPILNQAAMEQQAFAPAGIRTKEGLVETIQKPGGHPKHTSNLPYEERKDYVAHQQY